MGGEVDGALRPVVDHERVAVKLDEIADWMISDEAGGMRGGFSVEVFKKHGTA